MTDVLAQAQESDWRNPDPDNTLYLELAAGRVVIELAPAFAPRHVANIRALARSGYWDGLAIVRVQDNYVVQWGDPEAGEDDARPIAGGAEHKLPAEFFTSTAPPFLKLREKDVYAPEVGWSLGFPAARDPAKGQTWLAHCYGMVGAGRDDPPDSSNGTELYAVIGHSPRHLDRNITMVGRVIDGIEHLSSLPRGAGPLGFFEYPDQRIPIHAVRLEADVPLAERTPLQVLRTDTTTFARVVETRRNRRESWFVEPTGHVELCNVPIPVRTPPDRAAIAKAPAVEETDEAPLVAALPSPAPAPVPKPAVTLAAESAAAPAPAPKPAVALVAASAAVPAPALSATATAVLAEPLEPASGPQPEAVPAIPPPAPAAKALPLPLPPPASTAATLPATRARPCPAQQKRLDGIGAVLKLRPDDAALHYYLSGTWAACGDVDRTLEELDRAAALGDGFLPVRDLGFERLWDDPRFRARRVALDLALPQVMEAQVIVKVPQRDLIPEGIALDRDSGRIFVGSMAKGQIVAIGKDGVTSAFAGPASGLNQVVGLTVDPARRLLYAVSTNQVLPKKDEAPSNAVFAFDLASGERKRILDAAGASQLNDVTVGADGTLFATDSGSGAVFRATLADAELALWMPPDTFPGANGLTLSPDGRTLYVAHATGIARVQLGSGVIVPRIPNTTRENVAGIDGLYATGDSLIGIQNVTNPGRVVAIDLDRDGAVILGFRTLLSHHRPEMDEPTTGAIDGDRFLLLADSYIARLAPDGRLRDPDSIAEPTILSLPLGAP